MLSAGTDVFLALVTASSKAGVAGKVRAAHAGGNFDVLDQLCERLCPAAIKDGLLVLGRRPFGVA
jgi:hypothetical protein